MLCLLCITSRAYVLLQKAKANANFSFAILDKAKRSFARHSKARACNLFVKYKDLVSKLYQHRKQTEGLQSVALLLREKNNLL